MSASPPFVDKDDDELDLHQIWDEAIPLVGLIILFGSLALLPYLLTRLIFGGTILSVFFVLFVQLVLAVGTAVVLMYVIARAIQLADT